MVLCAASVPHSQLVPLSVEYIVINYRDYLAAVWLNPLDILNSILFQVMSSNLQRTFTDCGVEA